jgi:hypothetical protein
MQKMPGAQRDFINAKGTRYTKRADFVGMKTESKWFAMRKDGPIWMCMYGSPKLGGSYTFSVDQVAGPAATAIQVYQAAKEIIATLGDLEADKPVRKRTEAGHSLH